MKKIYTLLCLVLILNIYCEAQFVTLDNDEFRTFLVGKYPACFNGSGQLDTTCTAITTEDSLTFRGNSASSFDALGYFDALQYLDLSYNYIDYPNTLLRFPATLLYFKGDHITNQSSFSSNPPFPLVLLPAGLQHFDHSYVDFDFANGPWPAGLKYMNIAHTQTSNLGTLPATLDTLICNNLEIDPLGPNGPDTTHAFPTLPSLPTLPATLKYLDCSNGGLTVLPALPSGLTWLNCSNNFTRTGPGDDRLPILSSLPSLPASLIYLNCSFNKLTSIPGLPASLLYLDCTGNKYYYIYYLSMTNFVEYDYPGIGSLPALPSALKYLNCGANNLGALPALPPELIDLNINISSYNFFGVSGSNHITALPALPLTLAYLNCARNPLTCLPHLPASMGGQSPYNNQPYNLLIGNTQIGCIPNSVPGMRLQYPAALCNVSNNTNACDISPIIAGNLFYDNNSNGIQEPGELPRANVRVNYSNGLQTFSDINGHYEGTADIGSNTITIDPPMYYNAVPATFTHTVSAPNSLVTDLVALQPNISIDSLKITITDLGSARPNLPLSFNIKYENIGTTVLSPDIIINYDNSRLSFQNSTNASVTNNGTALLLSPGVLTPGQKGGFNVTFVVSINAVMNEMIKTKATITGGTDICIDSIYSRVVNSLDPNDKYATPKLTLQQVTAGNYINYIIRFQNTGTASALNIFLTDTLSALVQANTLQMIEASHACKITQNNNKLLFEFLNINLPDSNSNEPASHGYVRFRIKPLPSLILTTVVPNKASIYFDFNQAVLTNTATTTVDDIVVPVKLSSFTARKQQETVQLYWSTEQEINSKLFIVERSFNGSKWNEIGRVNAAGNSAFKINYTAADLHPAKGINYYRLKQIDVDGNFEYSEIRSVYFGNDVNIVLVPNPAVDKVTLYLPGNSTVADIHIYNLEGRLLKRISTDQESVQINISAFSKGIYMIKINGRDINEVKKLLVE